MQLICIERSEDFTLQLYSMIKVLMGHLTPYMCNAHILLFHK